MIDHAGINVSDWAKAKTFYDAAFAAIGAKLVYMVPEEFTGGAKVGGYGREKPKFWLHESKETMDDGNAAGFLADLISYQHPDYDTKIWPPKARQLNDD